MTYVKTYDTSIPFMDQLLQGVVTEEEIDEFVSIWHDDQSSLNSEMTMLDEFLGMTFDEYKLWVRAPEALPFIKKARAFDDSQKVSETTFYHGGCI